MSDWKQRNHKFSKSMADAQFTYIEAEIENAKLQKLVKDMWECIKEYANELDVEVHGYIWPYVKNGYSNKVRNGEGDFVGFPDRMRELGIEVAE